MGVLDTQIASTSACSNAEQWAAVATMVYDLDAEKALVLSLSVPMSLRNTGAK
jgi:hypothetical protein